MFQKKHLLFFRMLAFWSPIVRETLPIQTPGKVGGGMAENLWNFIVSMGSTHIVHGTAKGPTNISKRPSPRNFHTKLHFDKKQES